MAFVLITPKTMGFATISWLQAVLPRTFGQQASFR
jgi:hypothetical protein